MVGTGGVSRQREHAFLFQVPLNPTLMRGWAQEFPPNNERVGRGMGGSQPGEDGLAHPRQPA
jgi:hypothetical protein